MERLIADANKVKEAHGEMADLSIERFSDVVEAIHLIQNEMGITGTTAKEAEHTISGSINAMKASWANLLVAIASGNMDIGTYVNQLVNTATIAFDNIMPVVENALTGIASFVEKIAPIVAEKLPGMVKDVLPKLLNAAGSILEGVINALPALFTTLFTAIGNIDWLSLGTSVWNTIKGAFEGIAGWFSQKFTAAKTAIGEIKWDEVGTTILTAIGTGFAAIKEWIVGLFSPAVTALTGEELNWQNAGSLIIEAITTGIGNIVDWATTLFTDASTAISEIDWAKVGSDLRGKIEDGVKTISEWFTTTFGDIIGAVGELGWAGLGEAIVGLIKEGLAALDGLFTGLLGENWENFKKAFEDLTPVIAGVGAAAFVVAAGFAATKAAMAITDIITNVKTGFSEMFAVIAAHPFMAIITAIVGLVTALVTAYNTNEDFRNKVDAAWKAIKETAQTVWATISGAVELAFEAISKAWESVSGFFTTTIPEAWNTLSSTANEVWTAIQESITTAIDAAKSTLETTWGTIQSKAEEIWGALKTAAETAWQAIQGFIEDPISAAQETLGGIWTSIQSAVTEAWTAIKNTITNVINAITTPINDFIGTVSGAVNGVLEFLGLKSSETPDWNSDVNNKITTPMSGASSAIQGLLGEMANLEAKDGHNLASTTSTHTENTYKHTYNYEHWVSDGGESHSGSGGKFAKAMFGGKILHGATVFGMDDNGPMVGGEAGPEAVVGVNSLNQQIREAVRDGLSGIVGSIAQAIGGRNEQPVYVVLDTGELVGAIGGKMDAELGKIGAWKSGGAA